METGKNKNLDKIEKLFSDCGLDLENRNIYQWDDSTGFADLTQPL